MLNRCERRWIHVDGASGTLSATAKIFSGVRIVWLFTLWFIDQDASFLYFFHKITNIRSWRCFPSSKICTHTFCNITQIFKVISQYFLALFNNHTHTQPYSFSGRINLITCQIRQELSVTIYEISTNWKKKISKENILSFDTNNPFQGCQITAAYIYIWPFQFFSEGYDLASHNNYVVCVNFMHKWRGLQFKVDVERQIFENSISIQFNFYLLSEFLSEICWEEVDE